MLSWSSELVRFWEPLCAGVNSRIILHQDPDGDAPLILVQIIDAHHVSNPFAMNRVIGAKIQSHNDCHANDIVLGGGHEIQATARHVRGRADFLGIHRIAGANENWF